MGLLKTDTQRTAEILVDWLGPETRREVTKRAADFLAAGDLRSHGLWLGILAAVIEAQKTKPEILFETSWNFVPAIIAGPFFPAEQIAPPALVI